MATGYNVGQGGSHESPSACLQWILVENAIVFNEIQFLTFRDKGAYFLIGPNQCGKSSLFEMARRCLSSTKNTSLSSFFDDKRSLIVICEYKLKDKEIISSLVGMSLEDRHVHVKIACELIDGKIQGKGADTVKAGSFETNQLSSEIKGFDQVFDKLNAAKTALKGLKTLHEGNRMLIKEKVDELVKSVGIMLDNSSDMPSHDSPDKTDCNRLLEPLDGKVVHVFGNRSIGSLQWSESNRISSEYKDENYQDACKKAEIITSWCKQKKMKILTPSEKRKEKGYFKILTDGSDVKFVLEDDQSTLKVTQPGSNSALLKLSEGIVEAKTCSILLAIERFGTILFEEPERGMHPQMINRLRDLILPDIKGKTILVTTHHPAFTTTWNMERIFLFRPVLNTLSPKKSFKIIPVRLGGMSDRTNQLAGRFLSAREYSTMFYAARIIFVEGPSDEVFVTELKNVLIAETDLCRELLGIDIEKFLKFLTGMDIINVGGKPNLAKFEDMCNNFCIDCYCLEDTETPRSGSTDNTRDTRRSTEPSEKNQIVGGCRIKEKVKRNWYRWKEGELEDVIVNFTNKHDIERSCSICRGSITLAHQTLRAQTLSDCVKEFIEVKVVDGRLKRTEKRTQEKLKKGKFIPHADKSKVQEFLKCAITIALDPLMRETEECKLLVDFVHFLVDNSADQ